MMHLVSQYHTVVQASFPITGSGAGIVVGNASCHSSMLLLRGRAILWGKLRGS